MLALVILSTLFTWLLCASVCIGTGSLILRCFGFVFFALDAFWTGVAIIVAILQLYHFFRPIDSVAAFLLAMLAFAGLLWNGTSLLQQFVDSRNTQLLGVLFYIPALVIIAFRAAGPCEHYDTGLYGAQAIRWFITYPLLPGLGNVIAQIGFNSSVFLSMAALDHGPWRGLIHHLFVPFLIAAFFASIIPAGVRVFRGRNISPVDWFFTLLFVPAAIWASTGKIVGANTDLPTSIVCLMAAAMLFRALDKSSGDAADETRRMSLVLAMLLFSLAVTFKISSLVFASLGWSLAWLKLWPLNGDALKRKWLLNGAVLLSAVIVLPWIARGLTLSGYPFFPSTALSIPVDWRVPATETQVQAEIARSFARIPQIPIADTRGWDWIRPWLRELVREREGFLIPLSLAFIGGIVVISRMSPLRQHALPQWLWLLVPALAGLIFWFFEAPAIRFGEPVIWTAGATLGTLAGLRLLNTPAWARIAIAGLLLITGWAAHPRLLWGSHFRPSAGVQTFLPLPQAQLERRQTNSSLEIYVPLQTNQCWDAPLPCSPYFKDTLRLRQPGNLKRGFTSKR